MAVVRDLNKSVGLGAGVERENEKTRRDDLWLSRNLGWALLAIVGVAAVIALAVTFIFRSHVGGAIVSLDVEKWGQVGDFFGGLLNPLFGFLTIVALVLTLLLQSRELKMSREELELSRDELAKSAAALSAQNKAIEHQGFEQTFFAWLATYRDILGEVSATSGDKGRKGLAYIWRNKLSEKAWVVRSVQRREPQLAHPLIQVLIADGTESARLASTGSYPALSAATMDIWEQLYAEEEDQLDSLFRVLYRLFHWIDTQPDGRLSVEQKWLYAGIVRSQLSWTELVYLFYNGFTRRGRKFKFLVEKYALFDNLTFGSDGLIHILKESPPSGGAYEQTAYDSDAARAALGLQKATS